MANLHSPFRYDFVGSFLRPDAIKNARAAFAKGEISAEQLKAVEDEEITKLVAKQKAAGYHAITDGEFRRSYWHLDFMWGLNGVEEIELERGYIFHGEETTPGSIALSGKIAGENHPFVEHYKFVKKFEEDGVVARQTIPAPAQMLAELFRGSNSENTLQFYPDFDELVEDIAAAYRTVIKDLYDAGCRNIQFDDCTWGMIVDDNFWKAMAGTGLTLESEATKYLRINNLALAWKPEDLTITTHVCRGNYHSTYASEGAYDAVAPYLFANENVDAFYLEYDDERSGGFKPLAHVAEGKKVVLGLVTTKSPVLESEEDVVARIHAASKYLPLDQLYLSPQCGFASCEIGNKLTEDEQWAKLSLVKKIATDVWGE